MFEGSIVALVTPMRESGQVDEDGLRRLLDFQVHGGSSAVVIAGTTGESVTLTGAEFDQVLGLCVEHLAGQIPVIAGTGTACTRKSIDRTRKAEQLGAAAALLVTPYYNKPGQAGLKAHFDAIAAATTLPLIPYNVPARTGVDLLPETLADLAPASRFVAVKEALRDRGRVQRLQQLLGSTMAILSGDDSSCLESLKVGCRGVISVAANIVPRRMSQMCQAAAAGDWDLAGRMNAELSELFIHLAVESNPIPVKWAAYRMGLIPPGIRLPLIPLDKSLRPGLERCLHDMELLTVNQKTNVC